MVLPEMFRIEKKGLKKVSGVQEFQTFALPSCKEGNNIQEGDR